MASTTFRLALASTALATLARAQAAVTSSVVSFTMPLIDSQTIYGSVISVGASATEVLLNCPAGEDSSECGLGLGVTATMGPATFGFAGSASAASISITYSVNCDIADDVAACTQVYAGPGQEASTSAEIYGGLYLSTVPVTLTAGLDKLTSTEPGATETQIASLPGTTLISSPGAAASSAAASGAAATAGASSGAAGVSSASTLPGITRISRSSSPVATPTPTTTTTTAPTTSSVSVESTTTPTTSSVSVESTNAAFGPKVTQQAMLAGIAAVVGGVMAL